MSFRDTNDMFTRITSSATRNRNKTFYLACEGERTEVDYFKEIQTHRRSLGIKNSISIKCLPIIDGRNNPLALAELLIETKNSLNDSIDDEFYLVCDRDKDNFTQFSEVVDLCTENNINFSITTPCFEFWLLLHFTNCDDISKSDLLENRPVSHAHTFISNLISEKIKALNPKAKGYAKNTLLSTFKFFQGNIKNAINHSQLFSNDIIELESTLGTRVHLLLQSLLSQ